MVILPIFLILITCFSFYRLNLIIVRFTIVTKKTYRLLLVIFYCFRLFRFLWGLTGTAFGVNFLIQFSVLAFCTLRAATLVLKSLSCVLNCIDVTYPLQVHKNILLLITLKIIAKESAKGLGKARFHCQHDGVNLRSVLQNEIVIQSLLFLDWLVVYQQLTREGTSQLWVVSENLKLLVTQL